MHSVLMQGNREGARLLYSTSGRSMEDVEILQVGGAACLVHHASGRPGAPAELRWRRVTTTGAPAGGRPGRSPGALSAPPGEGTPLPDAAAPAELDLA